MALIGELAYGLPHGWEVDLGYLRQPEFTAAQPKTLHALMASMNLDLDQASQHKKGHKKSNWKDRLRERDRDP